MHPHQMGQGKHGPENSLPFRVFYFLVILLWEEG